MFLRVIARIRMLQSRFISPRNSSQKSPVVGGTIAGILVVLVALVALAVASGRALLLAVGDFTGVLLGLILGGVGVVEVAFVASGLTIIGHFCLVRERDRRS
jgi:hypothetical protein